MASLPSVRVPRPAPPPVRCAARWVVRPDAFGRGQLAVRNPDAGVDRLYATEALFSSDGVVLGWALTRLDSGAVYHVNAETQECDCGDCTFRQRRCKHSAGLAEALAAVCWSAEALTAPLTAAEVAAVRRAGHGTERVPDPTERDCGPF